MQNYAKNFRTPLKKGSNALGVHTLVIKSTIEGNLSEDIQAKKFIPHDLINESFTALQQGHWAFNSAKNIKCSLECLRNADIAYDCLIMHKVVWFALFLFSSSEANMASDQ